MPARFASEKIFQPRSSLGGIAPEPYEPPIDVEVLDSPLVKNFISDYIRAEPRMQKMILRDLTLIEFGTDEQSSAAREKLIKRRQLPESLSPEQLGLLRVRLESLADESRQYRAQLEEQAKAKRHQRFHDLFKNN